MNPQLRWKFILILMVIFICLFGLIGMPQFPTSLTQVKVCLSSFSAKLGTLPPINITNAINMVECPTITAFR